MKEREPEAASRVGSGLWEQISTLLLAVLIALGIRAFLVEPYRIPSGSMFPTLLVGDHLFVNKFVYGIKVPFTRIRLPGLREPERGEVVVFTVAKRGGQTFPADQRPELATEEFVKRIVGLPGDRIAFEELRARYPRYRVDEGGLRRVHMANVAGFSHVPVAVDDRA